MAMRLGSSPRVRGPPLGARVHIQHTGLIPAGAGTTPRRSPPSARCRAHPRGCGDHPVTGVRQAEQEGSSPRVRGPRHRRAVGVGSDGLIPAGAGTTGSPPGRSACRWAHPRGCGDHPGAAPQVRLCLGSSPRVRGPQERVGHAHPIDGLIPAGAGTTITALTEGMSTRAHPRGCGDHTPTAPAPHGRGAHPRGCGDHGHGCPMGLCDQGSSPRVRGPPGSQDQRYEKRWAHPRGCGDHVSKSPWLTTIVGSSPRVRGPPLPVPSGY